MSHSTRRSLALGVLMAFLAAGCADPIAGVLVPNVRPSVEFTRAPITANPDDPEFYAYRVYWMGNDPDGRVVRFEYCIDPTPTDSVWTKTERSEELIFFRATQPEPQQTVLPRAKDAHILVLRAVDNEGAVSPFKTRAFYSYTVAPDVEILSPSPSGLLQAAIPPSVFIRWQGHDPDGQLHDRPVYYRHRMLSLDDPANLIFLADPDSLRRRDAWNRFADWDSSNAESTFVRKTNLTPRNQYLFAVVAFDEAGAYSPIFSLFENMLQMYVTRSAMGPRMHVYGPFIDFTYESGGYTLDPLRWIRVEVGAGSPVPFAWDAAPSPGSTIKSYRWAVDLQHVDDLTPRSDEELDVQHWSRPSPLTTSCTLRLSPGSHFLYIEATDNNDISSLAVVQLSVVAPTFEHDLLVVDDTRLEVDKLLPVTKQLDTYKSPWPSATELDTFLFARGGFPWRQTQNPTTGAISVPGVFAGYLCDTLGTRLGHEIPSLGTRLSKLAQYKQVIWMVDRRATSYLDVLGQFPMTALRYMSSPGRPSALGAYLAMGGRIWLMGGGAGTVSTDEYDSSKNDDTFGRVYSSSLGELGPGRIMFDGAHWRSSFTANVAAMTIARSIRADEIAAAPWKHVDRWTGEMLEAPDYRRLPESLLYRDPATDPLPPTRRSNQSSLYYPSAVTSEYLVDRNDIVEKVDRVSGLEMSVLDTLYEARSLVLRTNPAPTMTWYHGSDVNRFVFSGFAPWDFRREDCIGVVDFVLQDLWGLNRQPVDRGMTERPGAGMASRPATLRGAAPVRAPAPRVTRAPLRR